MSGRCQQKFAHPPTRSVSRVPTNLISAAVATGTRRAIIQVGRGRAALCTSPSQRRELLRTSSSVPTGMSCFVRLPSQRAELLCTLPIDLRSCLVHRLLTEDGAALHLPQSPKNGVALCTSPHRGRTHPSIFVHLTLTEDGGALHLLLGPQRDELLCAPASAAAQTLPPGACAANRCAASIVLAASDYYCQALRCQQLLRTSPQSPEDGAALCTSLHRGRSCFAPPPRAPKGRAA